MTVSDLDPQLLQRAGLRLEVQESVTTITLDRPATKNSQTPATWLAMREIGTALAPGTRVVVVRGAGDSFSSGLDRRMLTPEGVEGEASLMSLLGMNDGGVPDLPARAQFLKLSERLTNFDQNGTFATDVYVPAAYRGVLLDTEGFPGEAPIEWPWDDVTPADFKGDVANGELPRRVMTPEELEVLGIDGIEGGFEGLTIMDPEVPAKSYSFWAWPLLPGEDA